MHKAALCDLLPSWLLSFFLEDFASSNVCYLPLYYLFQSCQVFCSDHLSVLFSWWFFFFCHFLYLLSTSCVNLLLPPPAPIPAISFLPLSSLLHLLFLPFHSSPSPPSQVVQDLLPLIFQLRRSFLRCPNCSSLCFQHEMTRRSWGLLQTASRSGEVAVKSTHFCHF